jgi:hypothetical protein
MSREHYGTIFAANLLTYCADDNNDEATVRSAYGAPLVCGGVQQSIMAQRGEGAIHYAEAAIQLNQQEHGQTDFDRATVAGGAALAFEVAGQTQRSNEHRTRLMQLYDRLTEDDDRAVVAKLYGLA